MSEAVVKQATVYDAAKDPDGTQKLSRLLDQVDNDSFNLRSLTPEDQDAQRQGKIVTESVQQMRKLVHAAVMASAPEAASCSLADEESLPSAVITDGMITHSKR